MNRGGNGDMRNVNNALDTINAAATAIVSADSRVPPPSIQKRRWRSFWSGYWCFGSKKNSKRIGNAILVPDPTPAASRIGPPTIENATQSQTPAFRIPFVAPPSSPASFLPSEPPSAVQSPAGSVSLSSSSPGGPRSMFAIGPYAHETHFVTPPVFSTYTTQPSTAPFTPPPESVHLTTPSSPEVPFAQLLDPINRNNDGGSRFPPSHYEFQSYLLQPGSPVGPLISPGSAVSGSGTSSPFQYGAQANFPLARQDSVISPLPNLANGSRSNDVLIDHRVSFELTAEDVVRCVEKKRRDDIRNDLVDDNADDGTETEEGQQRHQKQRAASLGSIKEFNFDHLNMMGCDDKPCIGPNWWANEMMQPGVS